MSFGLSYVPASFMDLMNTVLKLYLDMFLIVLDYILIYSSNEEDHDSHLRLTLHTYR